MVETKKETKVASEKLGISGFTLGIVGIALVIFNPIAGILCSMVGIVFCIIQKRKNKTTQAKVGLILGVIGIIVNLGYIILAVYWIYPFLLQQGI